jgi:AraC-like DNA-binding protein
MMPFSECTLDEVAATIATSSRTLQRQLAENGTTFQKLRDQVRADLALKYLRQSTLRFAEISEILGFAEPSVFTRSFRRWHGSTPREARRSMTAAPDATPARTPMPIGGDRA